MNLYRLLLILTFIGLILGCAGSLQSRSAAFALRQELAQNRAMERFPEEYKNFIATLARAETLAEQGESLQAENIFRLALIKGYQLALRSGENDPSGAPVREKNAQADSTASSVGASSSVTGEAAPTGTQSNTSSANGGASPSQRTASSQTDTEHPSSPLLPGDELPMPDKKRVIGNRGYYTVKKGDSLKRIGARLGVDWRQLARSNGLSPKAQLKTDQIIAYDNRKIVPSAPRNGIVINIADRTLYLLKNGVVDTFYPVAVGKPPKPDDTEDWSTPTGRFIITSKAKDPVWKVPQSIQDEMEQSGKEPIKEVPPGKNNPLGKYAMKTSLSGIVIHGTNAPLSIYSYASHGCVRVMPEHMEQLFPAVAPRTAGIIVYQPVKLAVAPDGRVFMEVNTDIYDRFKGNLESEVRRLVITRMLEKKVDWNKIAKLLKKKSGIPEEITRDLDESVSVKPLGKLKTVSVMQSALSHPQP